MYTSDPEKDVYANEVYMLILTALKSVRRDDREVFLLCELEGLTYQEIAETLGVSKSTVYRRLQRAKAVLRKALGQL